MQLRQALIPLLFAVAPLHGALAQGYSAGDLMVDSGVDLVFEQFGPSIGEAARLNGLTTDAHFLDTWESTAATTFDVAALNSALESALAGNLADSQLAELGDFYRSEFGRMIVGIESEVLRFDSARQAQAVADGLEIYEGTSELRRAQIDELLVLAGADLTPELVRQSSRGLMLGMSLVNESDIEIPWDAIDEQIDAQMPMIEAQIKSYQQSLSAYTYRDISDDEMETYLAFLRTDAAAGFYATYVKAVTQIVAAAMTHFGQQLAQNLTQEVT